MNNLLSRAITGTVFVALVVSSIIYSEFTTMSIFSLFLFYGLREFYTLFNEKSFVQINTISSIGISFLIYLLFTANIFYKWQINSILLVSVPIFLFSFLPEIWRKKKYPLMNIGTQLLGIAYVVFPFVLLIDMRINAMDAGELLIGMFVLIWSNDTFAYLSGRFFGKTKLFERISPKKTWEGMIGGMFLTLAIAFLIGTLDEERGVTFWLIAALIIVPGAIFGDLIESMFKRSLNIKDSGTLLPGHGGILDRFDAAIFSIPLFYAWYTVFLSCKIFY